MEVDLSNALIITNDDGEQEVMYNPFPKQLEVHLDTAPKLLAWGNRGGGKSKMGRFDCHMKALTYPGFKYCILRRSFPELEKSHLLDAPAEVKKLGGFFNGTKHIAYYANGSVGFFSHCQSEQDVLNLLSAEFGQMFFDELTTFEWEMFTKLSASCRVPITAPYKARILATTNPLGASAEEVNRYFVLKDITPDEDPKYDPAGWNNIRINAEDNPYLDVEEYHKSFAGNPAHVIKAWIEGVFSDENAIFDFKPNKDGQPYHVIPFLPRIGNSTDSIWSSKAVQIYRAVDFGYWPDPSYCVWIAHLGNRYIAFKEKLWYKTVASDVAADIVEESDGMRITTTFCDPTMDIKTGADVRSIKDIFEDNGVPLETSINNRELYAHSVHTALWEEAEPGIPRIQIYKTGCPYLTKTLPQMRYDPKRPLAMADHKQDHATVALAYFLISSGSMEHRSLSTGPKLKPWMRVKSSLSRIVLGSESVK